ncbi:heterokaryon incompatibility protein-domain-containing protein, partial [Lasiosphaeris hirsuta]
MASRQTTRKRKRSNTPKSPSDKKSRIEIAPYSYQPLDKDQRQIRIFELLFPGQPNDELCGKLMTTDPESRPEYDAVSYVWGDTSLCSHVRIDGQRLPVAQNSQKALNAIRLTCQSRVLWVDAICINQGDIHERGYQVQLMRLVFTNARVVRVWLDQELFLSRSLLFHLPRGTLDPQPLLFFDHAILY